MTRPGYKNTGAGGGGASFSRQCIKLSNGSGRGSTNTNVVYYDTIEQQDGSQMTILANGAVNGTVIEVTKTGVYSIGITVYNTGIDFSPAIMSGSAVNNTFDWAEKLQVDTVLNSQLEHITWVGCLDAGDRVWVFANSATANLGGQVLSNSFEISRVS